MSEVRQQPTIDPKRLSAIESECQAINKALYRKAEIHEVVKLREHSQVG